MSSPATPPNRRAAFGHAVCAGVTEAHLTATRWADALTSGRRRTVSLLVLALLSLAGGGTAWAAEQEGGCASESANALLDFTQYAADFLIGVGSGMSVLMFSIGGLFIIFGGTPQRVSKGMELIKQTVIGLAILASGVFIREVVVGVFFQDKEAIQTSC